MGKLQRCIGDVLRGQREDRLTTLRELSAETGIGLGYISEIERGRKNASWEMIEDMCDGLDMSVEELLIGVVGELQKKGA